MGRFIQDRRAEATQESLESCLVLRLEAQVHGYG
jgi:hypothetical protein